MLNALRTTFRSLARTPGFAVLTVAVLALGVGTSTVIFSVVHALLLKPLRYADSSQLVAIQSRHLEQGTSVLAPATFMDLARESHSFTSVAAQQYDYVSLTHAAAPARLTGIMATADYFKLFGVAPLLGRTWVPAETRMGANGVVVLGENLWRREFGGRDSIIGQTITLDERPFVVIGVMPEAFIDPWGNSELWRPAAMNGPDVHERFERYWSTFGRLRPGVTLEQARSELATLGRNLQRRYPSAYRGWGLDVADLQGAIVGQYRQGLLLLLGAVGCVMLVTCANVAGLSIVRSVGLRRARAIRAALGASATRLALQSLGESLLLALAGGALGVLLARWGVRAVVAAVSDGSLPRADEIGLNLPVLLSALGLTLATGVAFGLAPAWSAARARGADALKDGARGTAGRAPARVRSALVVGEIALAVVLLVAAGLLARSLGSMLSRPAGLRTEQLLAVGLALAPHRYDDAAKRRSEYDRILEGVAALPGVESAGLSTTMPFTWGMTLSLAPVGPGGGAGSAQAYYDSVSPGFFRAAAVPLLAGRIFGAGDDAGGPPVAIVSARTAQRFFGAANPLGRHLRSPEASPGPAAEFEIVGVVGDVLREGLAARDVPLQVYRPLAQRPTSFGTLIVHTTVRADSLTESIKKAIWRVDPDQAIGAVNPVSRLVSDSVSEARLYAALFGLFAGLAMLLAVIGVYGVVADGVAQRTREFGVRSALGARPEDILALVARQGIVLVLAGAALGVLTCLGAVRFLQAFVFGVSLHDPVVILAVAGTLVLAALGACVAPAWRAARLDPATALRSD